MNKKQSTLILKNHNLQLIGSFNVTKQLCGGEDGKVIKNMKLGIWHAYLNNYNLIVVHDDLNKDKKTMSDMFKTLPWEFYSLSGVDGGTFMFFDKIINNGFELKSNLTIPSIINTKDIENYKGKHYNFGVQSYTENGDGLYKLYIYKNDMAMLLDSNYTI